MTPGKAKATHARTPRFQAMINNFESRAVKSYTTPKQNRFNNPDETPPTTAEPNNVITARTINFKPSDSPTYEDIKASPLSSIKEGLMRENIRSHSFSVSSPTEQEISNTDHYKTCIAESPDLPIIPSPLSEGKDLSQLIAKSIQETLSSAFSAPEGSTEIQLSIKITKRTVSIKESRKVDTRSVEDNDGQQKGQVENESTTIWSRLVSGLKWVVWGDRERRNGSPEGIAEAGGTINQPTLFFYNLFIRKLSFKGKA